jgi:DNA polymerase I-like protein with 3'-5' exonuclease and polymerase domains
MFDRLRALALKYRALSVDLETTKITAEGVRDCSILLIAMCAGRGVASSLSVAVEPTKEAVEFLVEMLKTPGMRIVGHNILKFDMPVLYYQGIIRKEEVKASIYDTLPFVWLLNENVPHDLKYTIKRYFNYTMITYEEAYESSPVLQGLAQMKVERKQAAKYLEKGLAGDARAHAKKIRNEELDRLNKAADELPPEEKKPTKKSRMEAAKQAALAALEAFKQDTITLHTTRIEDLNNEIRRKEVEAANAQRAYAQDDARQTLRLFWYAGRMLGEDDLIDWARVENNIRGLSAGMEDAGVLADPKYIEGMGDILLPMIEEFEADIYNMAHREFNIRSNPELQQVIYDDLEVPPIGGIRVDKNNKEIDERRSTKEALLARMTHPIGQAVLNYRTAFKLHSSFVTKLSKLIRKSYDGRIHPSFNTTVRTGRWSCKKPNLQQIPSRKKAASYDERIQALGPKLRTAFIAPPGMKLIVADLSQVELRLIAHVTEDPEMLAVYNEYFDYEGVRFYTGDIHQKTALIIGVDRKTAKNINFGLSYGLSAEGFAVRFKIYIPGTRIPDVQRTTELRDGFMDLYDGIPRFMKSVRARRDCPIPKVKFSTISGRFRRFPKDEKAAPGKILNAIIQGSAADVLKAAIAAIGKFILDSSEFAGTQIVLQVHDEVLLYAPEAVADKVAVLVKYILEAPWFTTQVPILSSVKLCDNWAQKDDDNMAEVGILPPKELGIKPCVAMLSPEQRKWAEARVVVDCYDPVGATE